MKTRTQKIRLGLFIVMSASILVFLIVYFTARELLEKTDIYYTEFHDVSVNGMEVGSSVKYLGIKVGTISAIRINPEDITGVIVELSLKHNTAIKADAKADIIAIGITGLKSIEIRGGSNEAPLLHPKSFIEAGSSMTEDITEMAEMIAIKTERLIDNLTLFTRPENLNKITRAADKIAQVADHADLVLLKTDAILGENRENIRNTVVMAHDISTTLLASSLQLEQTVEKVNQYITGDTITGILANIRDLTQKLNEANVKELVESLTGIAQQTQQLLLSLDDDINKGSRGIVRSQEMLQSILRNLDEASHKINQNPSVLLRGTNLKKSPDHQLKKK